MGVINLNEELENMLYYAGSNKAVKMPPEGFSTRSNKELKFETHCSNSNIASFTVEVEEWLQNDEK